MQKEVLKILKLGRREGFRDPNSVEEEILEIFFNTTEKEVRDPKLRKEEVLKILNLQIKQSRKF